MSLIFHSAEQLSFSFGFHILDSSKSQVQIICKISLTFKDRKLSYCQICIRDILFDKVISKL